MCRMLFLVVALIAPAASAGDDALTSTDDARHDYLVQRLAELTITETDGERRQAELKRSPLMTWQNPISGADGGVFVWTIAGRPVALSKTHLNDRKRHRIESSITLQNGLQWTQSGSLIWAPEQSTAADVPITDAAPPRETKAARLLQMREVAASFEIEDRWGEGEGEQYQLRLLPRPLHRYESSAERVIDGAIFGYSQGTNPEAVVSIEAVKTDSGSEWRCKVSRLTGYAITARRKGEIVMEAPKMSVTGRTSSFHYVYEPLNPYPFDSDE